ncbi:putative carboxyl-terminal peptidase [Trifolium repens]|nr:putative carboxyl-terminal peptidase [Trifolium repens]
MEFSPPIISLLLHLIVLVSFVCPINSSEISNHQLVNQTFGLEDKFHKLKKTITTYLQEINKPAVKTIQSRDGDIIDCVLSHEQPAFDHPLLKGQKPLDPSKRLKGHNQMDNLSDIFQLWNLTGESCPEGTIPIRRTKEQDLLRAGSISRFGRKIADENKHVHSIGYVNGDFYGARAVGTKWV